MRAILFIFLVTCMGSFAQAQNTYQSKVETVTMPIVQNTHKLTVIKLKGPTLTGVFVLKNSRVKRALNFKIRKKDAKLV